MRRLTDEEYDLALHLSGLLEKVAEGREGAYPNAAQGLASLVGGAFQIDTSRRRGDREERHICTANKFDTVIRRTPYSRDWDIVVETEHGKSYTCIAYCPFCGEKLE
jgi:hypothetical protein